MIIINHYEYKYSFEILSQINIACQEVYMDFSKKFSIVQKELNLSQKDFATKIGLSQNAISQYLTGKRKPDINTIQKLIDLGISPLFLFSDSENPFDKTYDKFVEARLKYGDEELIKIIDEYMLNKSIIMTIKEKIQRIKGQTFFEKLSNGVSGNGERMLILLYSFVLHLEKTNLQVGTNDLDIKFHKLLAQYEFSKLNTLKYGTWIQDKDISTLIDWAKNELDTISMSEIIMTLPEIKEFIRSQLYKIDKLTIELVEKYFS